MTRRRPMAQTQPPGGLHEEAQTGETANGGSNVGQTTRRIAVTPAPSARRGARACKGDSAIGRNLPVPDDSDTQGVRRLAYSPEEAAAALGISRELVNDLIRTRRLRSVKAGSRRLIGVKHLEAFLAGDDARDEAG